MNSWEINVNLNFQKMAGFPQNKQQFDFPKHALAHAVLGGWPGRVSVAHLVSLRGDGVPVCSVHFCLLGAFLLTSDVLEIYRY